MPDSNTCAECGAELMANLPKGLCSQCALRGALELSNFASHSPAAPTLAIPQCPQCGAESIGGTLCSRCNVEGSPGKNVSEVKPGPRLQVLRSFGDYELLEEIARGGMGIVYKARQVSLDRVVAVKLLLLGPYSSEELIRRFHIEASAAASLQHPNIVAIHEVGVHAGEHYFAMDLVDGPNLAQLVYDQSLSAKRTAGYMKAIAEAIHYAHERGILHRDLKPSNVLIDSNDQPRVTDFGLAKRVGTESQPLTDLTQLTLSGHVLGSPGYMPPEQVVGARGTLSRRSDVYSLGAMFYHLLTGRPPFGGGSLAETLQQVQQQEPVSPRLLNPGVPLDLETICLKCLGKVPEQRYHTAKELADEFGRFLNDESIIARPLSGLERMWRLCRRRPLLTGLAATVVLLLMAIASVSTVSTIKVRRALQDVQLAKTRETDKLWESYRAQARAHRWSSRAGRRFDALEALSNAAAIRPTMELRDEAAACMQLVDMRLARRWPNRPAGLTCFDDANERVAFEANGGISIRRVADDREEKHLPTLGTGIDVQFIHQFSRTGRYLLVRYTDGLSRLWDLETETARCSIRLSGDFRPADFTSDDKNLAVAEADGVTIYQTEGGVRAKHIPVAGGPCLVRYDPSERNLAVAGCSKGFLVVVNLESGAVVWDLDVYYCNAVAWHPNGRFVVAAIKDRPVQVWYGLNGQFIKYLGTSKSTDVAFSRSGDTAVVASSHGTMDLYDFASGRSLVSLPANTLSLRFGADDRSISGFAEDTFQPELYDVVGGREMLTLTQGQSLGGRSILAFSGNGDLLAYSIHPYIVLWNTRTRRQIAKLPTSLALDLAFDSGGNLLASTTNGLFRWPIRENSQAMTIGPCDRVHGPSGPERIAASDTHLVAVPSNGRWHLIRTDTGEVVVRSASRTDTGFLAISRDAEFVASGGPTNNHVSVWKGRSGQLLTKVKVPDRVLKVAFSPDGSVLVIGTASVCLFMQTSTWKEFSRARFEDVEGAAEILAFSGDLKLAATTSKGNPVRLIDPATGKTLVNLASSSVYPVAKLAMSQDGSELSLIRRSSTTEFWDLQLSREHLARLHLDWAPSSSPPARATRLNAGHLPTRVLPAPSFVDLTAYTNSALANDRSNGIGFNLSTLTLGPHQMVGVDFDVRGVIQLSSRILETNALNLFPRAVPGLSVKRKCNQLHFLHACSSDAPNGTAIGRFVIRYATGELTTNPIVYNRDVRNWLGEPNLNWSGETLVVAWTGTNSAAKTLGKVLRLFKTTWINPRPHEELLSIDYVSAMTDAAPFLVAITAE